MIGASMLANELLLRQRQSLIVQRLKNAERVIASDLAEEFKVSEDTIRRDLREMAAAGLCERVYGGALPVSVRPTGLAERMKAEPERKMKVARAALSLFESGMLLFLDAGSTNLAIAKCIPAALDLTIATNAPSIANELFDMPNVELIMIGGRVDRKVGAAIGSVALQAASGLRPDLCMLGACGLDKEAGITAFDVEDAEFKKSVARRSLKVAAAILNDKLGTAAAYSVLPVGACDYLAVEADFDPEMTAVFETGKTRIVRA
jgi:DeoR/GlpR family transcriptional regulator of sugar metabolism